MSDSAAPLIRVERGLATPEEIAAVTAVLLRLTALTAGTSDTPATVSPLRTSPAWFRPERSPGFSAPRSWAVTTLDERHRWRSGQGHGQGQDADGDGEGYGSRAA